MLTRRAAAAACFFRLQFSYAQCWVAGFSLIVCVQVERFLGFAEKRSDLEFFVGPLGSQDHLGHKMDEMAALFAHRSLPPNVVVNEAYGRIIEEHRKSL